MKTSLTFGLSLAALMLLVGCGASSQPLEPGLPDLRTEIAHLTSSSLDFVPLRNAGEFAHDLGYSNVDSVWSSAIFKSGWIESGYPLSFSAYCIYRLEMLNTLTDVQLDLNWDGESPDECWVALANWDTLAWDWFDASSVDSWDITGLQTAVHLRGTPNDASDIDEGWSIEIALVSPVGHTADTHRRGLRQNTRTDSPPA